MLMSKSVLLSLLTSHLASSQLQFIEISDAIKNDDDIQGVIDAKFCLGIENALEEVVYLANRFGCASLEPSLN